MVFGDRKRGLPLGDANHRLAPRTLGEFRHWAIRRLYSVVPFEDYSASRMKPVAQLRARARTCATRGNLNSAKQCHPGLTSPGGKARK